MDRREIDRLISDLAVDETRNCSILNFVRENRVLSIDRGHVVAAGLQTFGSA